MAAERARSVLMTADTVGGVWHHALELSAALGRCGIRVTLATMGDPLTPAQRSEVSRLPTLTVRESTYRLEWMEDAWDDVDRAGEWLLELERSLRPDRVHLNQFAFGALPFRAPRLVVAHSCVSSWWRAVRGEAAPQHWNRYRSAVAAGLAGADLVGAPTRAMLASLAGNHGHCRSGVVLPNGRSAATYRPAAQKRPVVLAAGRLWDPAKNIAALEAVAPGLSWPVCVAGSICSPGGSPSPPRHVQWLGELGSDELGARLGEAAIYALPARYEPFGQSVLEAALSGCALVLGDIESLREVWGPAALYVAPDDHRSLRSTLSRLIEDDALRETMGAAARARARRYTPEAMADAYVDAYGRLAGVTEARAEESRCMS
jgi:glycogen synthase